MKCPNCNETLLMTERQTVEIDYCPNCRGVWLDKGELDKLLEQVNQRGEVDHRSESVNRNNADFQTRQAPQGYDNRESYRNDPRHRHPNKKKSFLSDFFDFD